MRVYEQIVPDFANELRARYAGPTLTLRTDAQGAYSVTPLRIAEQRNGEQLRACGIGAEETHVIIDATVGVGGDAISFMLAFPRSRVYALEPDAARKQMLEHNVAAATHCVQAEFADLFGRLGHLLRACMVLYLDPEWGGPAYHDEAQVHLSLHAPGSAPKKETDLVACCARALAVGARLRAIVLKVPVNLSSEQWQRLHALPGVRARAFDEWLHGHVGFRTLVLVREG